MGDGGDANGSERGRRHVGVSFIFSSSPNTGRGHLRRLPLGILNLPVGSLANTS